ncbi:hypothetical protein ACIBQ6_22090 [Nonomuraea sp. NPDC049655]|uniref:hypothetical protein n=1 Tax=Nonomuraea sp. NPDC049655 TaxID=3364355 RepID=UPI0037B48039
MGIASRLQETFYRVTGRTELAEVVKADRQMVAHLQESIADLEARMYEPGWQRLTTMADQEFSRDGLRQISAVNRLMALKNPLIKRGLALRMAYVWGQGVEISARDEDVNALIQSFLDDPGNKRCLTGAQAREENERALDTDANLFWALFTNPRTGKVKARSIPWDEIADVITNPEDISEPWYYKRVYYETSTDPITGGQTSRHRTVYYPALGYRPEGPKPLRVRDQTGEAAEVMWDAPVYHMKVGGLKGWKFGLGVVYAAIDWAAAYKDFLTDWATLVKALSRFAWRLTSKGSKQAAAKARIAAAPATDRYTGEAQRAGATALMTPDMALEAVPKSGATIDSESGRPLAAMTASALDLPVTMLLGDPGVTGARATAETLDSPTERTMEHRRQAWTETFQAILGYVIAAAVKAPQGPLKGTVTVDDEVETVELAGGVEATLDISWPDIDDLDPSTVIDSITKADQTGYVPPLVIVRLLLEALGVKDVDEIVQELTDEDGNFKPPEGSVKGAGQAAVDAYRRGEDPARMLGSGDEPNEPPEEGDGGDDGDHSGDDDADRDPESPDQPDRRRQRKNAD